MQAALTKNETENLKALCEFELLDTAPEQDHDNLVMPA